MTMAVERRPLTAEQFAKLDRAMVFLKLNWQQGPSLKRIAGVAGFSPSYFLRRFAAHFGKSPKEITTELQIAEAKRLLLLGKTIPEVAGAVGMNQVHQFGGRFKKQVGLPPATWLRKQRAQAKA